MTSIAELGIKINSSGVDETTKKLNELAESAVNVDKSAGNASKNVDELSNSVKSTGSSTGSTIRELKEFERSIEKGAKSTAELVFQRKKLTELTGKGYYSDKDYAEVTKQLNKRQKELAKSTLDTQKELDRLLKSIDPAKAALEKLDREVETLGKSFDKGLISQKDYEVALGKMDEKYKALEGGSNKFSISTKASRANVLQLLNALKSGNWKVASNNIAELGISSGMSAASLAKLALPMAGIIGTLGILGYAYNRADKETQAFNKAIYLTGNYAGTTLFNLNQMTAKLSKDGFGQGKVVEALAEVTKTGKFTEDQLSNIAKTALQMEAAFNIPISETISKFKELGESPTRAIVSLNDQYNFLTGSVYDQIRALELQGDKTGATKLAIQEFSRAQQDAAQKAINSTGYLERSWGFLKLKIEEATAAVVNFGKESSNTRIAELSSQRLDAENKLNDLYAKREQYSKVNNSFARSSLNAVNEQIKKQEALKSSAEDAIKAWSATSSSNNIKQEKDAINYKLFLDDRLDTLKTHREKVAEESKKIDQALLGLNKDDPRLKGVSFKDGVASGGLADKLKSAVQDRYKDRKSSRSGGVSGGYSMLQGLKEQEAVLRKQLETSDKLTNSQAILAKFEQQIADIKSKNTLTASQKVLLSNEDQIRSQILLNSGIETEIKLKKEAIAQTQWASSLSEELSSKQRQADLNTATTWMGERQAREFKEIEDIKYKYAKQKKYLADAQRGENALTQQTYDMRVKMLEEAMSKEVEIVRNSQTEKHEAEKSWLYGANSSYQSYLEEARDVSKQTDTLFSNAFSNMENSLVKFVREGKLSFRSFSDAILDDLARIGVRMASSSAMEALFSSFGSMFGAQAGVNNLVNNSGLFAKGGAFSGGVQAFAKGGAFTNTIIDKPTLFPFAKGTGLMGEAGAEAIMPLTRTASGDLGVRMVAGQASQSTSTERPQVNIVINNDGSGSVNSTKGYESMGDQIYQQVEQVVKSTIMKEKRQGGMLDPNSRRN